MKSPAEIGRHSIVLVERAAGDVGNVEIAEERKIGRVRIDDQAAGGLLVFTRGRVRRAGRMGDCIDADCDRSVSSVGPFVGGDRDRRRVARVVCGGGELHSIQGRID